MTRTDEEGDMDCQGCGATALAFDVHCRTCGAMLVPPSTKDQIEALGWATDSREPAKPSQVGPKLVQAAGAIANIGLAVGVGVVSAAAAVVGAELASSPSDIRLQKNVEKGIRNSRS
jgi:hypothetical protein